MSSLYQDREELGNSQCPRELHAAARFGDMSPGTCGGRSNAELLQEELHAVCSAVSIKVMLGKLRWFRTAFGSQPVSNSEDHQGTVAPHCLIG